MRITSRRWTGVNPGRLGFHQGARARRPPPHPSTQDRRGQNADVALDADMLEFIARLPDWIGRVAAG
jgi:hypothetical protein